MKFTIIVGSHRIGSQSTKVSNFVKFLLEEKMKSEVEIINLENNPLPLWGMDIEKENSRVADLASDFRKMLQSSDGCVLITPEWNGAATPAINNFFLYIDKELAHKPLMLVSVSSGLGGAYPIAELRSFGHKNKYFVIVPSHVIVRDVNSVLNDNDMDDTQDLNDSRIKNRIYWSLQTLWEYSKALTQMRDNTKFDLIEHSNGM